MSVIKCQLLATCGSIYEFISVSHTEHSLPRPLKIRVDIRDLWNKPQSQLQKSVTSLADILGHKIVPEVHWPSLWENLKSDIPEPETFVPAIVTYTTSWYDALLSRVEDNCYEGWTEELLTVLSKTVGKETSLHVEVSELI